MDPSSVTRPGLSAVEYRASAPMSSMDKNIIIVTATLLGMLILSLCMLFVLEYFRKCRAAAAAASQSTKPCQAPAGMNKLQIGALPSCLFAGSAPAIDGKHVQHATSAAAASWTTVLMCPICLSDFAVGDQIRLLPPCQHRFHVGCIDRWLSLHSSCPSCREDLRLQLDAPPSTANSGLLNILIR